MRDDTQSEVTMKRVVGTGAKPAVAGRKLGRLMLSLPLLLLVLAPLDVEAASFLLAQKKQPLRCLTQECKPFSFACSANGDCVSNKCYNGKCAMSESCRVRGAICYQYAPHTCCSGSCQPVVLKRDCVKLLGLAGADRQCDNLGVCNPWPDADVRGPLSTPWDVRADDLAAKYYSYTALTFRMGVGVRSDLFVARKLGQTYEGISADSVHPGAIRDAGVVKFTLDSSVDVTMWKMIQLAGVTYCAAPIVRSGAGGGYYAIGHDCCSDAGGFKCGDAADPSVKTGLVVTGDTEKYNQVVQLIDAAYRAKFHGPKKGIETPLPLFVRVVARYLDELAALPPMYTYVAALKVTHCVAPVRRVGEVTKKDDEINFWAVGMNCCSPAEGFKCGDVAIPGARSGLVVNDGGGEFRQAVTMATVKYGLTAAPRPIFVSWSHKLLVEAPA